MPGNAHTLCFKKRGRSGENQKFKKGVNEINILEIALWRFGGIKELDLPEDKWPRLEK
jgi:hypothetical protein